MWVDEVAEAQDVGCFPAIVPAGEDDGTGEEELNEKVRREPSVLFVLQEFELFEFIEIFCNM
jgi:hypothetical protein